MSWQTKITKGAGKKPKFFNSKTRAETEEKAARRRLRADWKELAKNPIPNCAAQPLESNIFEWHVNLKSTEEPLDGVVFHFILTFPKNYPNKPPSVHMPTGIPHPNCIRLQGKNMICADMLENGQWASSKQMNRAYTGWSSAYSVFTLLLQLQTLVMVKSDWKENHNGLTLETARTRAERFTCKNCAHKAAVLPEDEYDEKVAAVVWPPLGDTSTELQLDEKEDSKLDLAAPPAIQPMRCPNEVTVFDKLQRLEKSEREVLGWVQLHADVAENAWMHKKTMGSKEHKSVQKKKPMLKPELSRLPSKTPIWARVNEKDKNWRMAVFIARNTDGTCGVRFPDLNTTIQRLPTHLVRIPEPVQKKLKVNDEGKSTKGPASLDVIRCLKDNSPMWVYDVQYKKWCMGVLVWQTATTFMIRIPNLKITCFDRKHLRVPQPLRENLYQQLQYAPRNAADPGYAIPQGLRLPKNTPVFARIPHPYSEYKKAVVTGYNRANGYIVISQLTYKKSEQEVAPNLVVLPDHVRVRFMNVISGNVITAKPAPTRKVYVPPGKAMQSQQVPSQNDPVAPLPMKKRKSVPQDSNDQTRRLKRRMNDVSLTESSKKSESCAASSTSHVPMDISGPSDAETTSEAGSGLIETDPMHNIQALFEGDEIIAKDKRQAVVVSVGNNNLFGVRFDGDTRLTFLTRRQVAYYKRTLTPQGNQNVDPEKCYILNLGTTSMFHLLEFCTFKEIARLSCVCKDLRQAAEDSFLWRNVFSRYNGARLKEIMSKIGSEREKGVAMSIKNWKYAFMCEKEQIFQALRCYHTKLTFRETTLGIPIWFTVNPKKKCIDYIKSSCDLLGKEAYTQLKVRKTISKEAFTDWIPAYITLDHFKRSLPDLKKVIRKLAVENDANRWRNKAFNSNMCLDVFPQMLKTYTVLLSDKGISASEEALTGFCLIHRLFLACCLEWPNLRKSINQKIRSFVTNEDNRSKKNTPDLGNFLALLSATDEFAWKDVVPHYISESLDRSVLWACRKYPDLHTLRPLDKTKIEMDRLTKTWENNRVGGRLVLFWCYFVTKFCRNRSMFEQASFYDRYFGRPSGADMKELKKSTDEILKCCEKPNNWSEWFKLMGLQPNSNAKMTKLLRDSVQRSKRKGYTREGMNFDKVHASGVSRIVLAGESYSVDPTIEKVQVEDIWTYNGDRTYLDFSVVALDYKDREVRHVDYNNTRWTQKPNGREQVVMSHSGDVMSDAECQGKHTMTINLQHVPGYVKRLVFVVTVYTGTFSRITNAYVRLSDSKDNELCRGQAQKVAKKNPNKTLAVLGEMRRTGKKIGAQWEFIAHDVVGRGTVRDYKNICKQIPKSK